MVEEQILETPRRGNEHRGWLLAKKLNVHLDDGATQHSAGRQGLLVPDQRAAVRLNLGSKLARW